MAICLYYINLCKQTYHTKLNFYYLFVQTVYGYEGREMNISKIYPCIVGYYVFFEVRRMLPYKLTMVPLGLPTPSNLLIKFQTSGMVGVAYSIPLGLKSSAIKADYSTTLRRPCLLCQLAWLHQCCCCFMCC